MVISLFLDWVNFLWFSDTGFGLGLMALMLIWLYPVMVANFRWRMHVGTARACAALSMLTGLVVLVKTTHVQVLVFSVDATGVGLVLYLASSALFMLGVSRYSAARPL